MYSGDGIVLEVSGFTQHVVKNLCQRGYRDEWSTSRGWDGGGGTGMCEYLSLGTGFDNDGNLMADFSNPDKLGKDTVTWRLINSTGKTILVAQYSFRVLETTFQPLATPPS